MRSLQGDPPACHQGQGAAGGGLQPGPLLVYTVAKQDTYIHTNSKKNCCYTNVDKNMPKKDF